MSAPDRRGLLQRDHESLSIRRQCQLLRVARSSIYRPPRPANDNDIELMRREALARFGRPEIFNTNQGSQFTSAAFTGTLAAAGVRISMDGRGRWMDNVFIERLWRSLKYEDIYLKGYADGGEAKAGIASWITFYNGRRPHQALGNRTPMAMWCEGTTGLLGAAAADMMDNARALPTCPQPQQQTFAMVA